jgi:23S rRNA (cytidine2498-2'-O)-methyltransferase
VFARQWLPECVEVRGESIADLVQELGRAIDPHLDQNPLPWTFQSCTPDLYTEESTTYEHLRGRPALLTEKFLVRMSTYRRRAMERYQEWSVIDDRRPCLVIQAVLTDSGSLWVSVTRRFKTGRGRFVPLLWKTSPGLVMHDPLAPCRSYYKIEEAWLQTGVFPRKGETCVDLGAAPGGWSWAALKRGAGVIAVDFADLKDHVEKHPRCEHSRDNGYAFMPARTVDWMFCDMIVKPMATLGLLDRWLEHKACRRFVVNVKFRGKQPASILAAVKELQEKHQIPQLIVRHLYFDRNEITLIGGQL